MTKKATPNQFNLFGSTGAITEVQVAQHTDLGVVDCYLKCATCRACSGQLTIPRARLGDPDGGIWFASKQANWVHECCPECCKQGRCPPCQMDAARS